MASLVSQFNKPEFVYVPWNIARRVWFSLRRRLGSAACVRLLWGLDIDVDLRETTGRAIFVYRLYELALSEICLRMATPGSTALDVGGNIGYVTSLLATAVGKQGRVLSFEPNPATFATLERNVARWKSSHGFAQIQPHNVGLGESDATLPFRCTSDRGLAHFADDKEVAEFPREITQVPCRRLDEFIGSQAISMLKIDVEGHELGVLRGAQAALADRRVACIVFEEHRDYPSPVCTYLAGLGYTILAFHPTLHGVRFARPLEGAREWKEYQAQNFVAVLDPQEFLLRMSEPGYRLLKLRA